MRSKDEFVAIWERELQGMIFGGYVTKEVDGAALHRRMKMESAILRAKLASIWEEFQPKLPASNGLPGKPETARKA